MGRRSLIFALCLLGLAAIAGPARAADTPVQAGGYDDFGCASQLGSNACSGITRPANTTAYSSGQLVCGATCAPIPIVAGRVAQSSPGSGLIGKVVLAKSGSGTTNATFNVFLFSAPPTFPSLSDDSAYTGPYLADITSGIYIGQGTCTTPSATTDSGVWFVCTLDVTPAPYKTTGKLLYAMIEATGAYTPGSGEKFYVVTYEAQD